MSYLNVNENHKMRERVLFIGLVSYTLNVCVLFHNFGMLTINLLSKRGPSGHHLPTEVFVLKILVTLSAILYAEFRPGALCS
jgi:hypothetical protein